MDNKNLDELLLYKSELEKKYEEINAKIIQGYEACGDLIDKIRDKESESNSFKSEVETSKNEMVKIDSEIASLNEKQNEIVNRLSEVKKEIALLSPPAGSNGVVDLRDINGNHNYAIYLHNQNQEIGYIEYRKYHLSDYMGDVGYRIFEEYQGHGYAYEALCVLGNILRDEEIPDFWVTTGKDHIPSLKTIEKYGGILIKSHSDGTILYECPTSRKEEIKR